MYLSKFVNFLNKYKKSESYNFSETNFSFIIISFYSFQWPNKFVSQKILELRKYSIFRKKGKKSNDSTKPNLQMAEWLLAVRRWLAMNLSYFLPQINLSLKKPILQSETVLSFYFDNKQLFDPSEMRTKAIVRLRNIH